MPGYLIVTGLMVWNLVAHIWSKREFDENNSRGGSDYLVEKKFYYSINIICIGYFVLMQWKYLIQIWIWEFLLILWYREYIWTK